MSCGRKPRWAEREQGQKQQACHLQFTAELSWAEREQGQKLAIYGLQPNAFYSLLAELMINNLKRH